MPIRNFSERRAVKPIALLEEVSSITCSFGVSGVLSIQSIEPLVN